MSKGEMMMGYGWADVIEFVVLTGGAAYESPAKMKDASRAAAYREIYSSTLLMMNDFETLLDVVGKASDLISIYHRNVLDGTRRRIRSYFWGELKAEQFLDIPESISVFVEKASDSKGRIRISLEIDESHSDKDDMNRHNSIIERPLEKGCLYAVSDQKKNDLSFVNSRVKVEEMLNAKPRKVQICSIIEDFKSVDEIVAAVNNLKPYYDYVCSLY